MRKTREQPTLRQKLRAFALLAQCQAELALELGRLLPPVAPRRRGGAARRTHRRSTPKRH